MTLIPPPATTAAPQGRRGRRLRHRVAYLLITLLLLFIVVLLPFALRSILADFRKTHVPDHAVAAIGGRSVDRGSVAMDLIAMNEWEGTVTVRVTAQQECDGPCRWQDRYRFVSIWGDEFQPSDRPTVEQVTVPEALALSFLDLALQGSLERDYVTLLQPFFAALDKPTYGTTVDYGTPPANPAPPLPLTAYTGSYANDLYGSIEIEVTGGGLVLRAGPSRRPFPMRHWNRDTFLYQPTGENAYGPSGVTFLIGPDGRASGVTIEYFDIQGQGTLTRVLSAR